LVKNSKSGKVEYSHQMVAAVLVHPQSKVVVTIETNHPLGEARLEIGEKVSELQSSAVTQAELPTQWTFTLPSDRSLHWQFTGRGMDGTPMIPVKGRMRVRYDEPPRIDWRDPEDEIKVHMLAELPMRAQVSDDYGLTEASIVFQLGDEEEFPLANWSAAEQGSGENSSELVTQVKLDELLPLESFALSERDFVAYYAYAIDNRAGREQRVESDVRFIDIRPLRQFFAELEDMPSAGQQGNLIPELDEIIRRQRFLVNRTRKYVRSPGADMSNQLASIERMVESQSELADLTRFLMEFLISRGNDDTEALSQAEASMLQAADSLAVANFPTALAQEEDALRALAEARRTIELSISSKQTPQSQQEMRRFQRQLQQKLRRTPAKSDQQLADTLKQVASDQRRLAGETEKMVANGAKGSEPSAAPVQPEAVASEEEPNAEEAAKEEPAKELLTRQQDLLERLQTINEGLSAAVKRSPLVEKRMKSAVTEMDGLIGKLKESSLAEMVEPAFELADELNELAIHIDALAQPEPSNYVSAMRDMTTSLANMEAEMAGSTQQLNQLKEAQNSEPIDEKVKEQRTSVARMGRRLDDRAATIEDVLKTPIDTSNLAASEVADKLNKLVTDSELLSDLAESRQAIQQDDASKETAPWSEAAEERAREYADVAVQLDQMYRQLVTPRVDLLRQLEAKAARMSEQLSANGGSETKPPKKSEDGKSIETQRNELQKSLSSAGLEDVAEILSGGGGEESEETEKEGTSGSDPAALDGMGESIRNDKLGVIPNQLLHGKLFQVQKELRNHIQELILLEIATDRNAPIPAQYRELVDGYFRSITGDEMSSVEGKMAP